MGRREEGGWADPDGNLGPQMSWCLCPPFSSLFFPSPLFFSCLAFSFSKKFIRSSTFSC